MKKWIVLSLVLLSFSAHAKIYIDINQASNRSFPIAIVDPAINYKDADLKEFTEIFMDTLRKDLQVMGIFDLLSPRGFIEPETEHKYVKAGKINFLHWRQIEAQALIKGTIESQSGNFIVEMYLHDVYIAQQITAKRYVGKKEQAREIGHRFANTVVEELIGEKGVFDTQIAFVCKYKTHKELCVMNFNGWDYRKITDHKSIVLSPSWDPLTNSIYYTAFNSQKKPQLHLYQLERKQSLKLTNLDGMVIGLSFDPVTKNIVTSLTKNGEADIYLLDRYGAPQKQLTNDRKIDVSAKFSPDGKEMVFVSDREGSPQVYKMDLKTKKTTRLTFKGNNNASPSWSPKGDKIAFAGMDTDGQFDIFVMNTDGSDMKRLTYDTKNNEDPTWAPDGNFIAFISSRTGSNQIFMMRPNGKMQTQLTFKPWDHYMPAWERK